MGDGWGSDETQLNHVGTSIVVLSPIIGAMLMWGVIPVEVPVAPLLIVVAACGLVGGVVNLIGRGPLLAGAIIGLVMAMGGFGTVYWWAQGREGIWWIEVVVAFFVGTIPGFGLQFGMQQVLRARRVEE